MSENARAEESFNTEPDDSRTLNLVKGALELIETLFKNSKNLQDTYGLKPLESSEPNGENGENRQIDRFLSTPALNRIKQWAKRHRKNNNDEVTLNLFTKTKWAIYDKAKFGILVEDIRALVTGLYEILPVPNRERDKIVVGDIKSLWPDIRGLKQVEAASEDAYPSWSEAASVIIMASEIGSSLSSAIPDQALIQERMQESAQLTLFPEEEGVLVRSCITSISLTRT